MKAIRFKSIPENWKKEFLGLKCNTVRIIEFDDARSEVLRDFMDGLINFVYIEIENTKTHEVFTRLISDVTKFTASYIISWRDASRDK